MRDKIGIAVVGLGRVAKTHIESIRLNSDTTQLVALVDVVESLAKSTAQTYNTKFYTSVEAALDDSDVQAIVICLPNYLHKPVVLQAIEAGRHVLVEKPMAINLADAKEMVEKAREKGVILMTAQCYRFVSALQEVKQRMEGEIGTPNNLVWIDANSPELIAVPPWWQDIKKTGGLAFTQVGSHTVDMTLWIYEGRRPVRVYAEARSMNSKFEGRDETLLTISFDDESMALNYISFNVRSEKHEGLITGPKGNYFLRLVRGPMLGIFYVELFVNGELVRSGEQKPHNFALQMREFSEAVLQNREPIVKTHETLTQFAVLDAAKRSAEIHQPVPINYF
jgi:predicted dehydrogenase